MKRLFVLVFLSFMTSLLAKETNEIPVFNNEIKASYELVEAKPLFKELAIQEIQKLLKNRKVPSGLSKNLTKKYYKHNKYEAFFVKEDGIKNIAFELLSAIENDPVLKPFENRLFNTKETIEQIEVIEQSEEKSIQELIKLDFMLVGTYHLYMRALAKGSIDWKGFQEELKKLDEDKEIIANWQKYSVFKNIRKLLYKAVKEDDIHLAINEVNYTFPKAKELSQVINDLEVVAQNGGYTKVPKIKKSLKKENSYPQIKFLRQRLLESNDLKENYCLNEPMKEEILISENEVQANISTQAINTPTTSCEEFYDEELFQAVKTFQKRHGLVDDGIVGKKTIKHLNKTVEERIKIIRINLERMRWMPRTLGEKYLLVNIPEFNLRYFKEGEIKLQMPVIVGKKKHPTPIFSHKISSIVLNPYWRIPQRIVKNEIIPKLVEDPLYLQKEDIKTFENWDHKSMMYDTSSVDWSMYLDNDLIGNSKEAPMRFIQIPGKKNPLGKMKFMFPNKYSVYLHDTPYKGLFSRNTRAFSHGCIRLSKPRKLLETIANEDKVFTYQESKKILKDIEKTDIDLSKKIPVHIVYLTSWIDENGVLHFRDDIYNYDKMQKKFLYKKSL